MTSPDPRGSGALRSVVGTGTANGWPGRGQTANSAYSHVTCHAEVRKWKIIARTFMVLCLFADVVLIAFMVTA